MIFTILLLMCLAGLGWIRFAPSDPTYWHVDPQVTADQDLASGVRRRVPGGQGSLKALHQIILETPRTEVLAGSVDDGHITYITRSRIMGFPDYTTLLLNGDQVELWGRLRFGTADTGVNKRRVEGWLARLPGKEAS